MFSKKAIAKIIKVLSIEDKMRIAKLFGLKDKSLVTEWQGRGNKSLRRMGYEAIHFQCSCYSSPCQHEHLYLHNHIDWRKNEEHIV